jgi:hypothetical protein
VLTHGSTEGKIFANDWPFECRDLWEPFTEENCSNLIGKPKIFLVQACHASRPTITLCDPEIAFDYCENDSRFCELPESPDMLLTIASYKGVSVSNGYSRSKFIQTFCEKIRQNPEEDLISILTTTNRKVTLEENIDGKKVFKNHIISSLTRKFYFIAT